MAAHTSTAGVGKPSRSHDHTASASPAATGSIATQDGSQVTTPHAMGADTDSERDTDELDAARDALSRLSFDDPSWIKKSRAFADALMERFEKTSSDALLRECIDLKRQIYVVCKERNRSYLRSIQDLANSLGTCYDASGDVELLTEAIELGRESLALTPNGHRSRSISCSNLAVLLKKRFRKTGDESLLAEAVCLEREALSLEPPEHPTRSISCSNLAVSLKEQFDQKGDESLLTEVIDLQRESLSLQPPGHPIRSISCSNLAISLKACFNQTGDESLLSEAIDLERESLSLRPHGHPLRSTACSNLAVSLKNRFDQTGDESLLTEAVCLEREALSLEIPGHPTRFISCSNLAISLKACFGQTGDESLLSEAINLERESFSLTPLGHPLRSAACSNLAVSLRTRFERTGDESLLTEAIGLERESLSLEPPGHPARFISCSNLAISLRTHFERTGDELLLIEAIDLQRESLSLQPPRHPTRSISCSNLATSLKIRFNQTEDESLLSEAIDLEMEALSLRPHGHPFRSVACSNLAIALRTRFELTGDESLLAEAVDLYEDALDCLASYDPSRWRALIGLCQIYLNPCFSRRDLHHAIDYLQQALSVTSDNPPQLLHQVVFIIDLIKTARIPQDLQCKLMQCFPAALDLSTLVAGFVLDHKSQLQYLRDCQRIGPPAYLCAISCAKPELGLELLERGRAIIWSQSLHVRYPQLSGAPPALASELEHLLRSMSIPNAFDDAFSTISSTSHQPWLHIRDVRHKNNARIQQLIREIRSIPGNEYFMRGLSYEMLAKCATHNAVVVLIAAQAECHALIVQPDKQVPTTLKLQDITLEELATMSITMSDTQMRGSAPDEAPPPRARLGMKALLPSSPSSLDYSRALRKLWTAVVKPIISLLQFQKISGSSRPRLHWCPTGPFMFLPLHAAGIYDVGKEDCCTNYVVSSYTPTLTALLRAQRLNPSFSKLEVKLGLVAAMKTRDAHLPTLLYVEDEIRHVRDVAKAANISVHDSYVDSGAVVTGVTNAFERANFMHIACHGIQNPQNALSSGFHLVDGTLTVSILMDLNLKDAFFAFLSACETAKGDVTQPDQTVHLAAAMLFIGFRSVVATMWAMNDADGPSVAKLFYEKLFAKDVITLDAVPYALDYAVAELRKSGIPPERWATFIHMGA